MKTGTLKLLCRSGDGPATAPALLYLLHPCSLPKKERGLNALYLSEALWKLLVLLKNVFFMK
jgi:hypothetical protein